VSWSGWSSGAGITPRTGDNALVFSVSAPAASNETLAQSIADNEFLSATITPTSAPLDLREAEVRFSTRRIGFHAPLGYALFAQANAQYVSSEVSKDNFDETEHVITLPSTAAFSAINAPFELRIYAFGAQFDGHTTSLTGFKLTEKSSASPPVAPTGFSATAVSTTQVALTWNSVAGATGYEIARIANGAGESIIALTASNSFTDSCAASTAYRYRVRAVGGAFSAPSLATTIAFTNESLIRLAHLVELRDAVNAARATAGLPPQTWTNDPKIRAVLITELRNALSDALTALGLATTVGETPIIGMKIRATHFHELRTALQ